VTGTQDVTLSDLPLVVEFFRKYGSGKTGVSGAEAWDQATSDWFPKELPLIQCVKVSCKGHIHFLGLQKYRVEKISKEDTLLKLEPTSISQLLGIPIIASKSSEITEWHDGRREMTFDPDENHEGAILNLTADVTSARFGRVDEMWSDSPGGVIVARQDQKPILPLQVEVLLEFILSEIVPAFDTFEMTTALENLEGEPLKKAREDFVKRIFARRSSRSSSSNSSEVRLAREMQPASVVSLYDV
jgi:hypothetical protein